MRHPTSRLFTAAALLTMLLGVVAAAQQESLKLPPPLVLGFLKLVRERDHAADLQLDKKLGANVVSLQGHGGVGIVIEELGAEVEAAGLRRADLQTDVELRLRAAGIKVLSFEEVAASPGNPYLHVTVNAIPQGKLFVRSIDVDFNQTMYSERTGYRSTGATTWRLGSVARTEGADIRQDLRDAVDEFANDFLKANPK